MHGYRTATPKDRPLATCCHLGSKRSCADVARPFERLRTVPLQGPWVAPTCEEKAVVCRKAPYRGAPYLGVWAIANFFAQPLSLQI